MKTTIIEQLKSTGYSNEELWAYRHNRELLERLHNRSPERNRPTSKNKDSHK